MNPVQEQRQRDRERLLQSPTLATQYPNLKSLSVVLGYFDEMRMSHAGQLRYRANVEHAKVILEFSCPSTTCLGGGFDLSEVLLNAVTSTRKSAQGQLRCAGMRNVASNGQSNCQHMLNYKLSLGYAK